MVKLHIDDRIGGLPRYSLTKKPKHPMLVPSEIVYCVVYLGYQSIDGTYHFAGTAFVMSRQVEGYALGFLYLVTSKHLLDKIRERTSLNEVQIRFNLRRHLVDKDSRWVSSDMADWITHPTDDTVDVAVLPLNSDDLKGIEQWFWAIECMPIPTSMCKSLEDLTQKGIGVGNEISITGIFSRHKGDNRNIPIVRVGNIAAMPEDRINTEFTEKGIEGYLIEAKSTGGISGSPVFADMGLPALYPPVAGGVRGPTYFLIGLVHGHFRAKYPRAEVDADDILFQEELNFGIAIVVPASKILEVLNQPMIVDQEKDQEQKLRKEDAATLDDALDDIDEELSEKPYTEEDFEKALRKASRVKKKPDQESSKTSE